MSELRNYFLPFDGRQPTVQHHISNASGQSGFLVCQGSKFRMHNKTLRSIFNTQTFSLYILFKI